jgi:glycosyltransferase involved in cell wall biosynthesis
MYSSKIKNIANTLTEYWACRKAAIVSCSNATDEYAIKYRLGNGKTYTVYNGIASSIYSARKSRSDIIRIATVGLQRPAKCTDDLIRSFGIMKKIIPNLVLRVIGGFISKDYETKMRNIARDQNLEQSIEWLGHIKNVTEMLAGTDLFILPSKIEGLSIALLEAMSLELPCVVSDIPGNTAIIRHDDNGLIFPLGNLEKMAESVVRLCRDQRLAKTLGFNARKTQREKYSVTSMTDGIEKIYRDLIGVTP